MSRPIRFGFQATGEHHQHIAESARRAEELGFDTFSVADHVPGGLSPMLALTAAAAATERIGLTTMVLNNEMRHPVQMAWESMTLHRLSGGRFELGVGIGWLREEFDALGVPFERRGARFDDYVVAMKKVWSGEVVEHESDFLNWSGFKSYPIPDQKPHLPVVIGGATGKIYQRIARHGDGWFAPMGDPKELAAALEQLKAACDEENRDFSEIEITCMWPGMGGKDFIGALEDVGVSRVVTPLFAFGANPVEGIQKIAEEVING